ncbi:MAG TPA: hypothetical protein VFH48_30865 [Chloroflexota bacterium]|nr:hypothetical protein [Chloroflexota bacterium]
MARIIVCGYMIRNPLAGNIFAYFHYVLGLHRLGHDVLYLEESGWPGSCNDPVGRTCGDDPQAGLRVVRALMADHGIEIPVCYVNRESGHVDGAAWDDLKRMLAGADLLLNVGGVCWLPEFLLCRRRAIVDMDPLFTQVGRIGVAAPEDHQVHFSYGVNIGRVGCTVPTVGIDWIPTVPPVVLELWEGAHVPADAPFTTIANWSSYGAVTYRGEHYGQKDEELLRLLDLPTRTSQRLELALVGVETEVTNSLRRAGWLVRNAGEVSSDLATYRAYVTGCRGELSAAKHAYVKTHSGWFSDRSVCYLAAGLPVVLQDTGFGDWLPTGQGVLAFSSVDEAADCIERVRAGYTVERRAAREIAEEHFDARRVLTHLLERAMEA